MNKFHVSLIILFFLCIAITQSTVYLETGAVSGGGAVAGGGKQGDGNYLYNDSTVMYFNETKLNQTIDNRSSIDTNCSVTGSCENITYLNYENEGDLNITGNLKINTTIIFNNTNQIIWIDENNTMNFRTCGFRTCG